MDFAFNFFSEHEFLRVGVADGNDEAAAFCELLEQRRGNLRGRAGDDDGVERRLFRPALEAIADANVDVVVSQALEVLFRAEPERLEPESISAEEPESVEEPEPEQPEVVEAEIVEPPDPPEPPPVRQSIQGEIDSVRQLLDSTIEVEDGRDLNRKELLREQWRILRDSSAPPGLRSAASKCLTMVYFASEVGARTSTRARALDMPRDPDSEGESREDRGLTKETVEAVRAAIIGPPPDDPE